MVYTSFPNQDILLNSKPNNYIKLFDKYGTQRGGGKKVLKPDNKAGKVEKKNYGLDPCRTIITKKIQEGIVGRSHKEEKV